MAADFIPWHVWTDRVGKIFFILGCSSADVKCELKKSYGARLDPGEPYLYGQKLYSYHRLAFELES
jgi:hypothetical protein